VNVLLQIHIERMLQKAGVTMIVFGHDEDEPIAALDGFPM
jgi:ABC-type proline/glycine betaine transport system ATPase subunit